MALLSASLSLAKWIERPPAGVREVMGSRVRIISAILRFRARQGRALCRIALWDCIREAIVSFIGCYEVVQETTSQLPPTKQSHTAIQHNTEPAS